MSVVIFGGYGTFGRIVARELARAGISLAIAGRDRNKAEVMARSLGSEYQALCADVRDAASCRTALQDRRMAVNCAGPFSELGAELAEACLEAGCHYVDIADDRRYAAMIRGMDARFRERGLTAVYGCSSLPGISCALVHEICSETPLPPDRIRLTLFIGNRNPKGLAAMRSFLSCLGRPIQAPQGTIIGGRDRAVVPLPMPFGRCAVFNFESPDYDLLKAREVTVKVGFEPRIATYALALLACMPSWIRKMGAKVAERAASFGGDFGSSGGAVMAEAFFTDGTYRNAVVLARSHGQRMAALPCAIVVEALMRSQQAAGVFTAYELLGAKELLRKLSDEGLELVGSLAAAHLNAGTKTPSS